MIKISKELCTNLYSNIMILYNTIEEHTNKSEKEKYEKQMDYLKRELTLDCSISNNTIKIYLPIELLKDLRFSTVILYHMLKNENYKDYFDLNDINKIDELLGKYLVKRS